MALPDAVYGRCSVALHPFKGLPECATMRIGFAGFGRPCATGLPIEKPDQKDLRRPVHQIHQSTSFQKEP